MKDYMIAGAYLMWRYRIPVVDLEFLFLLLLDVEKNFTTIRFTLQILHQTISFLNIV
jgi:hypothetical protein